ncbi:MAG: TIGR03067 domain-containing protein [Planctomycetes bacterium]|nr:TIGR03067 domain-containing protein [Planctomycetota bacterium]
MSEATARSTLGRLCIASMALFLALPVLISAQDTDPRSLVTKAISAHGGEKNITKPRMGIVKSTGKMQLRGFGEKNDSETSQEEVFDLPKRWKRVTIGSFEGEKITAFNLMIDGKFWEWEDGGEPRQSKGSSPGHRFQVVTGLLDLLKEKTKLSPLKDMTIQGQSVAGVRASWDGETADYYFDTKTGLLVQVVFKYELEPGKPRDTKVVFADYKEVDGVKFSFRRTQYVSGVELKEKFDMVTSDVIKELKILEIVQDELFRLPAINPNGAHAILERELKALEGTWVAVAGMADGKETPPPEGRVRLTFEKGKFVMKNDEKTVDAGTFTIDPFKKPKAIELTHSMRIVEGKTGLGIYEIKRGALALCMAAADGSSRPTDFFAPEGKNYLLMIWKRAPAKK